MIAELYDPKTVSGYQPSQEIADFTGNVVKKDYEAGHQILHRSWSELNDYSVIERDQMDRRTFNSFVDESVEDPNEAWKWRGTRGEARKRTMAMHAQLTSNFMVPQYSAFDDSDEEHKDMAGIMRDGISWMTLDQNSNYRPSFLMASMMMLVSPVTYLNADYCRVYQDVKEKSDSGDYSTQQILDEVLSGFQANVMSCDQVLITNAYEQNIQKQRAIIARRYVEYSELKAKYGDHPNWGHLTAGIKAIFNEDDGLFYDVKDDDHPFLVEEVIHKMRRSDSEVPFLNGIYFGNENLEWNPIKHRDNRNAPKYNVTPFGYQRIGEHFFFYKSLVNIVGWDDRLYDALTEVVMNREFLDVEPPTLATGIDNVDTSVMFPSAIFATVDKDAKITSLLPPNAGKGYQALHETRESMADASISDTESGKLPEASQKAFSVAQAAKNANIIRSGVLKTLAQSIMQYGDLMKDVFLQHVSVPELDALGGFKYRSFILNEQTVNGKKVSKRIRFDESLIGRDMSKAEKKAYTMKLLTEIGYPENKEHLYIVNPYLFSKMRYFTRIDADIMQPNTDEFKQVMAERLYTLLQQNPFMSLEALTRDLLESYKKDADVLMQKQPPQIPGMPAMGPNGVPSVTNMAQMNNNKAVASSLPGMPGGLPG